MNEKTNQTLTDQDRVGVELPATEVEDIVAPQLNAAMSGPHGLTGGPSLFSPAAAGRSEVLPCIKKSRSVGLPTVVVLSVPAGKAAT